MSAPFQADRSVTGPSSMSGFDIVIPESSGTRMCRPMRSSSSSPRSGVRNDRDRTALDRAATGFEKIVDPRVAELALALEVGEIVRVRRAIGIQTMQQLVRDVLRNDHDACRVGNDDVARVDDNAAAA